MNIPVAGLMLAMSIGMAAAAESGAIRELAPSGKLRLGVAFAPAATALFVVRDAAGAPHGVTVDLGEALAEVAGVTLELFLAPNTGELTDALEAGKIDVAFMPVDDERRKRVDFGPAYFVVESTYLVGPGSPIKSIPEADRAGVTVVGIANTTTIRSAARSVNHAAIVAVPSIEEAMGMMKAGTAQAFAMSRDALPPLQAQLGGSSILDGAYQTTGIAIAVPKGRPAALGFAGRFLETAKADGTVRRALERAGLPEAAVAAAETPR